jgi:glutamine synthetase
VAVADSLDYMASELEKATASGQSLDEAVAKLLTKIVKEVKPIVFNGNNYSPEWAKEAARRKLLNLKNTVDALPELTKPAVVQVFERHKVLNARELKAREEIMFEQYVKTVNVEAQLMVLMANRYILPAALRYQKEVAESVSAVKAARSSTREAKKVLDRLTGLVDDLRARTDRMARALQKHVDGADRHARFMRETIVPAMDALRETGDQIELMIPHEMWPLPTYREMLFIK